ncbi:MAG: guanylate cyclase, partial [Cyanobacteria bacterium J083]
MTLNHISPQSSNESKLAYVGNDHNAIKPVQALKELVASVQREQNKIQDLLSSLGFALRSFNNLNQFLELTPLMAARVTDADGGILVLYTQQGQTQIRLEQFHCQNSQRSSLIKQGFEQVIRQVNIDYLVEQETQNNSNLDSTSKPNPCKISYSFEQAIQAYFQGKIKLFSTPILVSNTERGKLYIFSNQLDYEWTPTRRKLAQLVADQTAVAIANHELTVELRSKERQDRELEIASEIQLRLLPSKCPKIKGIELAADCRTASRVGGDYYDFIPTNYDRLREDADEKLIVPWSIVIGDVMGKGVPAGLIMTMTRGMLRAEVLNRHSPARIMEHLNRVMYPDLENSHRFVSIFYSEFDPQTKILSFTNAAHNPPLHWEKATGKIGQLDSWGMLVGLDPDSEYEDSQVQLASGDIVLYYTDGFTDALNKQGERYDEENLYQAFEWACKNFPSSQAILDYLFTEVENFIGEDNNTTDDMTLI